MTVLLFRYTVHSDGPTYKHYAAEVYEKYKQFWLNCHKKAKYF